MKNLVTLLVTVLLILWAIPIAAQKNVPKRSTIFSAHPDKINCNATELNQLFAAGKGQQTSLRLPGNLDITGPVTSRTSNYHNLQTVVIQLTAHNNALFSLSKQSNAGSNPVFVGRILNPAYGDGYELRQTSNGNYQFVKIELSKILETCNP